MKEKIIMDLFFGHTNMKHETVYENMYQLLYTLYALVKRENYNDLSLQPIELHKLIKNT